jgi:hypothetical protein
MEMKLQISRIMIFFLMGVLSLSVSSAYAETAQEILSTLPLQIGDFAAESSIMTYEDEAMGASLGYHSLSSFGSDLTVYVYNLGEQGIKDGVGSEAIRKAKDSALGEIKSLENTLYRNVKILSETQMDFSLNNSKTLKVLSVSFSLELIDPLGGASLGNRLSYLYITGLKGYICKIRATVPSLDKEKEIQKAVKTILSSLY